jgi:hypothetical protein
MDSDASDRQVIAWRMRERWVVMGGLTLFAMALAWLALDDITTDNATRFPLEYAMIGAGGLWLVFIAAKLFLDGARAVAAVTVAVVAAATFMAAGGLGHKRDGGWDVFWPQYLPVTAAWLWGVVLGIALIGRGLKRPAGAGRAA